MKEEIERYDPVAKRPNTKVTFTKEDRHMIKTMFLYKFSVTEIANKFGMSAATLRRALTRR